MHRLLILTVLLAGLSFAPARLLAASVYLTSTSPYASGEYSAESLAKKTTEVKTQRWFRLRLGGAKTAWTPEEFVLRRDDLKGACFIKRVTDLHTGPHLKTMAIGTLGHGARVSLIGSLVKSPGSHEEWVPVSLGDVRGFVPRSAVILDDDIRAGRAMFVSNDLSLRSAPAPDADIVAHSTFEQIATITESASVRWGRVAIKDRGELWWPIDDSLTVPSQANAAVAARAPAAPTLAHFKTAELFLHHKIHDIASSPQIPNLKILSAQGVFRTIDGDEWEKLPQFKDANYPVAISESGRIFVGTLVSDDQGETFHSFLKIENVVSPLHRRWNMNPKRLRILDINPQSADGQKISMKVDIGLEFPVTISTTDQGQTWMAL